jgi:hypothetical protein
MGAMFPCFFHVAITFKGFFIPYIDLYVVCVCIYYCAIALNDYLHLLSQI